MSEPGAWKQSLRYMLYGRDEKYLRMGGTRLLIADRKNRLGSIWFG